MLIRMASLSLLVGGLTMCTEIAEEGASLHGVEVIAHRGASAYAPENTLAAFERAVELQANWFELDCTLSKDDEVIVIHDDDVERTTNGTGRVADLTLEELKQLDAGTWFDEQFSSERLPTLGESLALAKGRIGVYIEVKDSDNDGDLKQTLLAMGEGSGPLLGEHREAVLGAIGNSGTRNLALTRKVIEEVRSRGMIDEVVIQSFSPVVCAIALAEAPEIRTELLASSSRTNPKQWSTFLEWMRRLGPKGFNIKKSDATPELLKECHERGMTVAVWTVNDRDTMRRMIALGVDALISDRPDDCLEVIAEEDKGQR